VAFKKEVFHGDSAGRAPVCKQGVVGSIPSSSTKHLVANLLLMQNIFFEDAVD
jgi:hypothetical protein